MKYDIVVTECKSSRAKTIVIRQLAHDPSLSLQKATELVDAGPVILFRNLDVNEVKLYTEQLTKIGVVWKAIESSHDNLAHKENKPHIEIPSQSTVFDEKPESVRKDVDKKKSAPANQSHTSQINHNPVIFSGSDQSVKKKFDFFEFESESKMTVPTLVFFSLILLILIGIIAFDRFKKNEIRLKKMTVYSTDTEVSRKNAKTKTETGKKETKRTTSAASRKDISSKQITESSAMVDSAMQFKNDYSKEIYFYKMAISFNRYNIDAWYGLLNAYKDAEMQNEMNYTKREMKEIFGNEIFSINEIIKPYGNLNDAQLDKEGNYLIEYNTGKTTKDDLTNESYFLIREIRQVCNCKQISLFAKTGPGRGLVVHISSSAETASFELYRNSASITFLN
jgi:hypothetical protein